MTKVLIVLTLLVVSADASSQTLSKTFKKLEWLVGVWDRTNVKAGFTETEKWTKTSEVELQGLNVRMKGADTAFAEKIKLIVKDKDIYYVADVPENNQPVYFKITSLTTNQFVCENRENDFPKIIAYKYLGNQLKATISGSGKSIDYLFRRRNKK